MSRRLRTRPLWVQLVAAGIYFGFWMGAFATFVRSLPLGEAAGFGVKAGVLFAVLCWIAVAVRGRSSP